MQMTDDSFSPSKRVLEINPRHPAIANLGEMLLKQRESEELREWASFLVDYVLIAEGTYTTLLESALTHVFIDRSYRETRAHREKRKRDAAELDPFIDTVLEIEHGIISAHKARAQIVIDGDYTAAAAG